jgi:hypothetical protein
MVLRPDFAVVSFWSSCLLLLAHITQKHLTISWPVTRNLGDPVPGTTIQTETSLLESSSLLH